MIIQSRLLKTLPILSLIFVLSGCQRSLPSSNEHGEAVTSSNLAKEYFEKIAESIEQSENQYLGTAQISRLNRELKADDLGVQKKVNLILDLAWHYLRLGQIDKAADAAQSAFREVELAGGRPSASMFRLKSLVYLREAEYRNCVRRHNCDCCVFPLKGGGIHAEKEPIEKARQSLLRLLAIDPYNLEAGWLLNISGMALGGYPENIPESYRLPEDIFNDSHDVPRFVDVAPLLGVDTFNLCGGAIVEDFNGDGLLDIVTSSYDPKTPLALYVNSTTGFNDRTAKAGLADQLGGLNCLAANYDNDGDMDILVLRGAWLKDDGQIRNSLLRNDGTGNFDDVTEHSGLAEPAFPTQAAVWGDFDNDGWLDLYVGNESRAGLDEEVGGNFPSQLFRNNADGTFTDVARGSGVTNDQYCKGVAAGDYDNEGDLDLYVSNRGPNRLYRNDGAMRFTDVTESLNVVEPHGQSFACWFFDYDNDGWLDLFVAAYQSSNADVAADYIGIPNEGVKPCLYHNQGDGTFENVAIAAGLGKSLLPMGANFGDIDNDGLLDIYLTTGRPDFATLTPNVMFQNVGGKKFRDVTFSAGLGHLQKGHGIAFADIDNDGDQDLYHQLGGFYPGDKFHNALFNNPLANESGDASRRFIYLKLIGTKSNRQAIGARIRIIVTTLTGDTREFHRSVGAVSSFGGSPIRQEIGLGNAKRIERIEILWPGNGTPQIIRQVELNGLLNVVEGNAARRTELRKLSVAQ